MITTDTVAAKYPVAGRQRPQHQHQADPEREELERRQNPLHQRPRALVAAATLLGRVEGARDGHDPSVEAHIGAPASSIRSSSPTSQTVRGHISTSLAPLRQECQEDLTSS